MAREEKVNRARTMKLLHPEVTRTPYAHVSLSKARHLSIPNSKECVPVERRTENPGEHQ